MRSTSKKKSTNSLLFLVVALGLSGALYSGCNQGFSGDPIANEPPQVRFVNVPPDNSTFSANPKVNWVGSDIDGRIVEFRFVIAKVSDVPSGVTPEDYALGSIPFSEWSSNVVTLDDPANSATIPLAADTLDPVNVLVQQYLFLVAVDDKGAISSVVYRTFGRNDHFPETRMTPPFAPGGAFVDIPVPQFGFGGIPIEWTGTDDLDFPGVTEGIPLEFEWKLFGPYTQAESTMIIDSFVTPLFLATDRTYDLGETLIDTAFDFTKADTVVDSTASHPPDEDGNTLDSFLTVTPHIDSVAIILVDTSAAQRLLLEEFGVFDSVLDLSKVARLDSLLSDSISSPVNRLRRFSGDPVTNNPWTTDRSAVFFDLFRDDPLLTPNDPTVDTTRQNSFLFVVRSRDDAFVPDPTPCFVMLPVINPRHERDLLVISQSSPSNFTNHNGTFMPCADRRVIGIESYKVAKSAFASYVDSWIPGFVGKDNSFGFDTGTFDPCGADSLVVPLSSRPNCIRVGVLATSPDYMSLPLQGPFKVSLRDVLKHKVIIFYKENIGKSFGFAAPAGFPNQYLVQGLLSGVNYWVLARGTFFPKNPAGPESVQPYPYGIGVAPGALSATYANFFGIRGGFVPSWYGIASVRARSASDSLPAFRSEDFIGAVPSELVSATEFPPLSVDTERLRTKLWWPDSASCSFEKLIAHQYPFMDSIAALPGVGFVIPITGAGTETLYLYKSRFGERKYPFVDLPFGDYQGTVVAVRLDGGFFRTSHWQFSPNPLETESFNTAFKSMMDWLFARPWGGPGFGRTVQPISQPDGKYASKVIELHRGIESTRQQILAEAFGGRSFKNQLEYESQLKSYLQMKRVESESDVQSY